MHRRQFVAATALTGALAGRQALAQAATQDGIGALLADRLRHEGVGLVAARLDGERVDIAGAGRRSAAGSPAPDADTVFEYGSITKTFTGLLLADMVVRGELKLDDAVETVLPDGLKLRDSQGAPLTWADLATHRSGLPRLPSNLRHPEGNDPYDYSRQELFAFLAAWRPTHPRDQQWEYSNVGYGLLGEALALRGRTSYASLLRERVLLPLGLSDMRLALREPAVPGLAPGHDAAGRAVPNWRFDALAGAGALAGSARALARYAQAALGVFDHPLKPAFALALTPRAAGPSASNPIALAWLSARLFERAVFTHDGRTGGYAASLYVDPQGRRASLVLANAQVRIDDLALHLLDARVPVRDLAAEQRQRQREAVTVDAESMTSLAGVYAVSPQFKITLRVREGRLLAQATGQGEFELFAADPRRWFARVTPLELHFDGPSGPPPAFVLHQGGRATRFVRE